MEVKEGQKNIKPPAHMLAAKRLIKHIHCPSNN